MTQMDAVPLYISLRYLPLIVIAILAGIGTLSLFKKHKIFKLAGLSAAWAFYAPVLLALVQVSVGMALLYGGWAAWFYLIWMPLFENPTTAWIVRGRVSPETWALQLIDVVALVFIVLGSALLMVGLAQVFRARLKKMGLVTSGLYSLTRHPQYLGVSILTFAFVLYGRRPIDFIAWITLAFLHLLLAESEERGLEEKFGAKYLKYRERVPFILPLTPNVLRRFFGGFPSHGWMRKVIFIAVYFLAIAILLLVLRPHIQLMR